MKKLLAFDIEIYPNYSLFAFKSIESKKIKTFEIVGENNCLNKEQIEKLKSLLLKYTSVGFNCRNYDIPITLYALGGKSANELFKLSKYIIENSSPGWLTLRNFGILENKRLSYIDIQEPSPGVKTSLKLYGGRLHSKKLQDLPYNPLENLDYSQIQILKKYCINDLETTIDLYQSIKDRIDLRYEISKNYGQDVKSKSDAQIAEVIIKKSLIDINPSRSLKPPDINKDAIYRYKAPDFIKFNIPKLQATLKLIESTDFKLDGRGSIYLPKELSNLKLEIGDSVYKIGIGGLHSTENNRSAIPLENQKLIDKDVTSYYPSIISNLNLYPSHLGKDFLDIYRSIIKKRIKAKKENNKIVSDTYKICLNGSFGKLGSKYSALYSPDLLMKVTFTGQLSLLMLIERLESNGINIVSANTDGFVALLEKEKYDLYQSICKTWEKDTNFNLEEIEYKALYSRDVNNYLAITNNGVKGKGIFTFDGLSKNPQGTIIYESIVEFLTKGTNIKNYIEGCKDIRKFIHLRTVTGGAVYKDEYLGRVVRWIWSKEGDYLRYKKNGNKVPLSERSLPLMELPDNFDFNLVDHDRYIKEAANVLEDMGYMDL